MQVGLFLVSHSIALVVLWLVLFFLSGWHNFGSIQRFAAYLLLQYLLFRILLINWLPECISGEIRPKELHCEHWNCNPRKNCQNWPVWSQTANWKLKFKQNIKIWVSVRWSTLQLVEACEVERLWSMTSAAELPGHIIQCSFCSSSSRPQQSNQHFLHYYLNCPLRWPLSWSSSSLPSTSSERPPPSSTRSSSTTNRKTAGSWDHNRE